MEPDSQGNINYGLNLGVIQGFDGEEEFVGVDFAVPVAPPPPVVKDAKLARPGPKS